jgi:RecJ-like exonuclease
MANGKYDPEDPASCHSCCGDGIEVGKVTADSPAAMKVFKSKLAKSGLETAEAAGDAILRKEFPCPHCDGTGNHSTEDEPYYVDEDGEGDVEGFEPIGKKQGLRDWS